MGLIPPTITGKIGFYRSKNTPWAAHSTAIGTTTGAVTSLATKVDTAQTKLDEQIAAQQAAKNATVALHNAVRDMLTAGGDIVKQIRTKAAIDGDGVYTLAEIPPPATPSPVPAPGTPNTFVAEVRGDGSLLIKWKCPNPAGSQGTLYQVSRQLGGPEGDFVLLGNSGSRQFIDATLPASAATMPVTYRIVAIRSTVSGAPAEFSVKFGVGAGGSGTVTATVVAAAPKLAA